MGVIEGVGDNASFGDLRRAVMQLVQIVNGSGLAGGGALGAIDASGSELIRTAGGTVSVPRLWPNWMQRVIVTDRQLVGGGAVSGNMSPGTGVEYKVTVLDTGEESDWIVPWRQFDIETIGYIPAPIDDDEGVRSFGGLLQFPDGDGGNDLMLFVQEMLHGGTCAEAE